MTGLLGLLVIAAVFQAEGKVRTKCQWERDNSQPMPGRFIPQCEEDGSYSTVQCHGSTGYCWCVNDNGEKVQGTEIRFSKPDCTKGRTKSKCESERDNLDPMPGRFIPRCEKDGSYSAVQCHGSTGYCWCVNDNGEKLEGTEKRFGKPDCGNTKRRAKTECETLRDNTEPLPGRFIPKCEEDGSYSQVQCHGSTGFCWCVNESGEKLEGTETRFRKPDCTTGKTKCEKEREAATPKDGIPALGRFVPQCEQDGSYSSVQCHGSTGYCWCVNTNGEKIAGTEQRFKKPTCGRACEIEKKKAQELKKRPLLGVFEPECQSNGKYKPVQCLENSCYCVNEDDGSRIGKVVEWKDKDSLNC